MATNFTNKYMQVFQDYNEFSEHSADYVRGEDHIAFLIEENEVIYWLYLEQVWRPLNVRTTTTGQLEDGRTKVAVRLEYIEGGQKYTSVPNIPDPERITSMSRFLKDYPDIEEVNVSGTVNLTDLSDAFAGSKIKDFSMLDTSNVIYFDNIFSNIKDETRNLTLKINQSINNVIASDIVLNNLTIESTNNEITSTIKLGESDIKNSLIIKGNINFGLVNYGFYVYNLIESDADINLLKGSISSRDTYTDYNKIICKQLTIGWNNINNNNTGYAYETYCDKIIIEDGNNNIYALRRYRKIECYNVKEFELKTSYDNSFGGGIKFNNSDNIKITINDINNVGNFWFTTPIVDDAFYAKYAQYNTPISIFQYKTTFEEVADVNISSEVDSSLLYVDWRSINFDASGMNVEIHNIINVVFNTSKTIHFKSLIIDNIVEENEDVSEYPAYDIGESISADSGKVSGRFYIDKYGHEETNLLQDAKIYTDVSGGFAVKYNSNIFSKERNVILYNCDISINAGNNNEFDIYSLIKNDVFDEIISLDTFNLNYYLFLFKYYPNIELHVKNNFLLAWYNYFQYTTEDNPIYVDNTINMITDIVNGAGTKYAALGQVDTIYIKCADNAYINCFSSQAQNGGIQNFVQIAKNFKGILNIDISINDIAWDNGIEHIDINSVKPRDSSNYMTDYLSCDNETLINLITKLVDNTGNFSKTIYMYRSQSNIIGEENIAGAVAKNYEIAIIEN